MLYQIYETQRSMMEPFADLAEVAAKFYTNPAMPLAQLPIAQRVSAAYDLMHRLGKDYEKPVLASATVDVDGVDVAIHERIEVDLPFVNCAASNASLTTPPRWKSSRANPWC